MDQIDSSFPNPLAQLRPVRHPPVVFRNPNGAAAAERSKYVSHESVKHGRHELTHAAPWPQCKSLDLPADEMVDGLASSSNRLGFAGGSGSEEDITQVITVKIFQMSRSIPGCASSSVHGNQVQ